MCVINRVVCKEEKYASHNVIVNPGSALFGGIQVGFQVVCRTLGDNVQLGHVCFLNSWTYMLKETSSLIIVIFGRLMGSQVECMCCTCYIVFRCASVVRYEDNVLISQLVTVHI